MTCLWLAALFIGAILLYAAMIAVVLAFFRGAHIVSRNDED